jgi:hypothetical protein
MVSVLDGVGMVSATLNSGMRLAAVLSSLLSIELSALVRDNVYFSINEKITDEKNTHKGSKISVFNGLPMGL